MRKKPASVQAHGSLPRSLRLRTILFWVLIVAAVTVLESCEAPPPKLSSGAPAPQWKDLEGVDGNKHSLSDLDEHKAVVVVFTCNHCPVAKAYEDRFKEFAGDYQDKGVQLVAINCNTIEPDRLPLMKERAAEAGFNFPYLYDPTQQVGKDYGARVTPEVFVLDGDRKIAYSGAFDSNINRPDKHFVREVVDAILAGQAPATAHQPPRGCNIKYEQN